eukprot:6138630-Amphidinium_carterae.3
MQERLPAASMGIGAARALTLASVLIQSCYAPSEAMNKQWHTMSRTLMAGPAGWSDAFLHVAKPLSGFPSSMLLVEVQVERHFKDACGRA